ncbi:MAG: hypothetical protein AAFP22_20435, partial [Planctomycetota bacterium]
LAKVDGARIPLGGKTGTTNDFKNSAFVGFVPGGTARGFVAAEGQIVASYVGYDDNRPMKRGRIRISGASGALPAWMGTVAGITRFHPSSAPTAVRPRGDAWSLDATGLTRESVDASNGLASRSGEASVLVAPERTVALPGAEARPVTPVRPRSRTKRRWWRFW